MALDLTKLAQRRAALESRLAHATAALRDAQRKDDTRRKVIAGAALLAGVREGVVPAGVLAVLVGRMAERDAALFADAMTVPARDSEGANQ
ncbi:hypothetical protein NS226_04110 [Aureimonas ureilytica]|uniref:Mobilization protein n=1 Tax=Aureimonas ureilytica TaxID=401562 RepID=A0A175REE9_9HYPH|nr:hypothetical protein [Aureimonas ureilytica]KTQ97826.1 hypothetical protein NS226_04110 [Aureimonas ureilytica]